VGIRCADHVTPLYPQKLALTPPTGSSHSVSIVRSRTKATEFFFFKWTFRFHYHIGKGQGFDCVVAVVDVFHVLSFYFYKIVVNIAAGSPKKIGSSWTP